jgi:hypothetical protein
MLVLLNKNSLFKTFNVDSFDSLEDSLNMLAPSMCEYYLSNLASYEEHYGYFNRSNIQNSISFSNYHIFLDYDDNIFLEIDTTVEEYEETDSLW